MSEKRDLTIALFLITHIPSLEKFLKPEKPHTNKCMGFSIDNYFIT